MHPGSRTTTTKNSPGLPDLRTLILWFTAAALAAHSLQELPAVPALLLLSLPALVPWRGRWPCAAAALGLLLVVWHGRAELAGRWPAERHGEDVEVRGTVASLPERGSQAVRFLFEPEGTEAPGRIRVSWYRGGGAEVRGAECWVLTLRMRAPRGSSNPGGFDYEGWLFQQGIGATASVREGRRCETPRTHGILALRQHLADRLREFLPAHPARGLVAALTVGDRSEFLDADWDAFRRTGTSHLVAISGLHVGIIAGAAFVLIRWLWAAWSRACLWLPAQRAGLAGALLAALAYALLAGFQVPVQRALVMLAAGAAAAWMNRLAEPSRVLALAWFAVIAAEPSVLLSAGLWLSFVAVAAILYVSAARVRAPGFWHSAVSLQLMLAVALTPLTLFHFQGATAIAPVANVVAVPLFVLLTPVTLAAVLLALAWPAAGAPALELVADALQLFRRGLEAAASIPDLWVAASPPPALLGLALFGVLLVFAPRGLPVRLLGALCVLPMFAAPVSSPRGGLEVTALDVGQGLAVVVRTARHTLVYDAGPAFDEGFDAGESVVAPFLLRQGLRRVDRLVLSHDHNDHAGGIESLRALLPVSAQTGTAAGAPCRAGDRWAWDGVTFEILHPGGHDWPINNNSCVLRIEGNGWSILLPGDIEKGAERHLVSEHAARLRADMVLAPHHGSATSSTPEFVAAVGPSVVIHSAGWRNPFRHPRPEVRERYAAFGARQYVTGESGALSVWMGENGELNVEEWRRAARRFWNAAAP